MVWLSSVLPLHLNFTNVEGQYSIMAISADVKYGTDIGLVAYTRWNGFYLTALCKMNGYNLTLILQGSLINSSVRYFPQCEFFYDTCTYPQLIFTSTSSIPVTIHFLCHCKVLSCSGTCQSWLLMPHIFIVILFSVQLCSKHCLASVVNFFLCWWCAGVVWVMGLWIQVVYVWLPLNSHLGQLCPGSIAHTTQEMSKPQILTLCNSLIF